MRACIVAALAALGCSCLEFDKQLERCRDGGVWICGSTDGGATGGGGGGALDAGSTEGLVCNRGWCWEHPRPTGLALRGVWGTSATDLWVGGELGTVLHFDGSKWVSHPRDDRTDITTICGHDSTVYVGATARSAPGLNRVSSWDGGTWAEVGGSPEDINQLVCGTSSLWAARETGLSRLDWGTSSFQQEFSVPDEKCVAVAETSPTTTVTGCMSPGTGPAFVRLRGATGALEYELVDDGGTRGTSFGLRTLWVDPTRGVLAGIPGINAEIWQRDAGWARAWTGSVGRDIYSGAAYASGSLAVGQGGVVVDFGGDGGFDERTVYSSGNSYLFGVWSPPSGNAWMVGDRGCILERDAGTWVHRSSCDVIFEDFVTEPFFAAISEDALYRRTETGWVLVKQLDRGQVALWEFPDGGLLHLSDAKLETSRGAFPLVFSAARGMHVVSEDRVVIALATGELIDTNLRDGGTLTFDAGIEILRFSNEPDGTVWAAGRNGVVLRSSTPGSWTREDLGLTGATDFATGFGRQWAVSGNMLVTRPLGGTWSPHVVGDFDRVVPLDADTALLLKDNYDAVRVTSNFVVSQASPSPTRLFGRVVLRGDELWGLGNLGLVRFRLTP